MLAASPSSQMLPVNIVGSSVFGRYPKISTERTYNMFISDQWLINYAGFQKIFNFSGLGEGRGIFHSIRGNFLMAVVDNSVYKITEFLIPQFIGNLDTLSGPVSMDENLNRQICIIDNQFAYIFNRDDNTLTKQTLIDTGSGLPITPSYVCYHNTFFLIGSNANSENPQNWYAFQRATDSTISMVTQFSLETKADHALAVIRIPGKGNNVLVLGKTVCEVWTQIGGEENYTRITSFNIDNGIISIHTIAANDQFIIWVSQNEKNAVSIMMTDGGSSKPISTDGIDILLEDLNRPDLSTAFFYRQDGHLFYQITFYHPDDNLSLIYDLNTQKFFHVTDHKLNFHPARQLIYFNNKSYFISLTDAAFYEMSTNYITYNYDTDITAQGEEIPRIRIPKTLRQSDSSPFRTKSFGFWIEQGVTNFSGIGTDQEICVGLMVNENGTQYIVSQDGTQLISQEGYCFDNANRPRVDLSLSKNGNQSFGTRVDRFLNAEGNYKNRIKWNNLGNANELTLQLEFWGFQRFVVSDGFVEVF